MTTNGLNRIAIVGIGNVGVSVLESLLASKAFDKPVVLSRDPSANKNLEPFTKVTTIVQVDPEDTAAVVKTLQEHNIQALVATTGGANGPAQQPLLDASKQAQIQLFVSAEFGVDFRDIPDADLHPWILARKQFHTTLDEVCTTLFLSSPLPSHYNIRALREWHCILTRYALPTTEWSSLDLVGHGSVR